MSNNKRTGKKQQQETSSVKAADETPTPSVSPEVQTPVDPAIEPEGQVDPLMAEVEAFLSKRDELAQKIAGEIEALEQKLAELKETAASLFPDSAGGGQSAPKPKKPKPKAPAKTETAAPTETPAVTE
ncbi:MAG TPA: hypothetical protein VGM98_15670 [Schlesneria sp.]